MNREEILAKAQKQTDERELVIKNKAYKYASEVMTLVIGVIALFLVVDGYILENVREFTNVIIGTTLAGIASVYYAVYYGYVGYQLKNKMDMISTFAFIAVAVIMFKELLGCIL